MRMLRVVEVIACFLVSVRQKGPRYETERGRWNSNLNRTGRNAEHTGPRHRLRGYRSSAAGESFRFPRRNATLFGETRADIHQNFSKQVLPLASVNAPKVIAPPIGLLEVAVAGRQKFFRELGILRKSSPYDFAHHPLLAPRPSRAAV